MEFCNPYVSNQSKMESLQRWLIIHAHVYYNYNYNIVTDKVYDLNCLELVDMIERYPKTYKKTFYYPVMNDFDGSTGFDLPDRLKKWNPEHYAYLDKITGNLVGRYLMADPKKKGAKQSKK